MPKPSLPKSAFSETREFTLTAANTHTTDQEIGKPVTGFKLQQP